MKKMILAALLAAALPATVLAEEGMMEISDGYARSSNPKTGAIFMTVRNTGKQDCVLRDVKSDAARKAELHTNRENAEGMMEMIRIENGITIPAGAEHVLARGGDHVMLMGLKTALSDGDSVAVMLDFGDCGVVDASLPVDNARK
ncbi:MAG: copper chaperone PCu(A)C [Paracoccus sp. (in: a-proteobacteria)]